MKRILIAAAALAMVGAVTPAAAQVYVGADPGGVGVNVGPVGIGVGPDYWTPPFHHRYWRDYAYYSGPECRTVRTRIVTPHGNIIWRTRRVCD
jgi:hypothetical protein